MFFHPLNGGQIYFLLAMNMAKAGGSLSDLKLVGGWATPLKNMKVNWDDEIPNIWENKKCSKPPTSEGLHVHAICKNRVSASGDCPLSVESEDTHKSMHIQNSLLTPVVFR